VIDTIPIAAGADRPAPDNDATTFVIPSDPVEGYIDGIQNRRVFGWAWCRSRPTDPVDVEIRFDDRVLLAVRANGFRPDLAKAGLTDGRHAFEAVLENEIAADEKARITAYGRRGEDDPWVALVNRTIKPVAKAADRDDSAALPPRPIADLQPVLNGLTALQKRMEERIAGWRAELRADVEGEARGIRDQLTVLASSTDVLQMRIDAVLATLQEGSSAAPSSRRGDRTLTLVVAGLGIVSCASLVLGLIAVLG
jgi:hypothetical protein